VAALVSPAVVIEEWRRWCRQPRRSKTSGVGTASRGDRRLAALVPPVAAFEV
jgi:hypothetical protein